MGFFQKARFLPNLIRGFGVLPARSGVARIALQSGKPVISVGIALDKHGTHRKEIEFSNRKVTSRWMTRGAYLITVGAPRYLDGDPENPFDIAEASSLVTSGYQEIGFLE